MIYFVHHHTKFRPVPTGLNHVCLVLQGASRVAERLLAISIREHHTSLFTPITMFYSFPLVSVNCGSVRYGFANLRETFMTEHPLLTTANRSLLLNSVRSASLSVCSPASSRVSLQRRKDEERQDIAVLSPLAFRNKGDQTCLTGCGSLRSS